MPVLSEGSAFARRTRGSRLVLLAAVALCAALPRAHAQQASSVPVLPSLPVVGRLYQTPATAKVPMLGDLPVVGRLFVVPQHGSASVPRSLSAPLLPPVSLEAKSATLGQVLETLMDQAHLSYTLDASLERIQLGSIKLRKVPFDVALRTILKMTHGRATFRVEDGIYSIVAVEAGAGNNPPQAEPPTTALPKSEAPDAKVTAEPGNPGASTADPEQRFTVDMTNAPVYVALRLLFNQAHADYTLDPALRSFRVTVRAHNIDLRTALETVLKASKQPLTYRVENGIYHIVPKPAPDREAPTP